MITTNFIKNATNFILVELDKREKLINDRIDLINKGYDVSIVCNNIDIDKEFRNNISKFTTHINYCYSYAGYKFDYFCCRNPKQLFIGSNPDTKIKLFNSLKYLVITNYELFDMFDEKTQNSLMLMFLVKLSSNINNSITFNSDYDVKNNCYRSKVYDPIKKNDFINIVSQVRSELNDNNYNVLALNNNYYELPVRYIKNKKGCIKEMKLFSKEKLVQLIEEYVSKFEELPTIKSLAEYYNESVNFYDLLGTENEVTGCTSLLMGHYIKMYDLQDKIKMQKRRTKKELMQDSEYEAKYHR